MIPPAEIARLWRQHAGGLALFARVRCTAEADDLVQEAFIRLARQPLVPDDPLAWLVKTVRNLAIDAARSAARRRQREQLFSERKQRTAQAKTQVEIPWNATDAMAALETLSGLDRDLVIAHLWNNLSFRQIAEAFDMSSSTVNRRYLRALKKLKLELEGQTTGLAPVGKSNIADPIEDSDLGDLSNA